MGHYAGELGITQTDEYDYRAVNEAGFENAWTRAHGLKRCPRCFAIVEGKYALQHLEAAHPGKDGHEDAEGPTLSDFLHARIAEDESDWLALIDREQERMRKHGLTPDLSNSSWHPRGLAECESRRIIVGWFSSENASPTARRVLTALAMPYSGHPDYRDEWRP